MADLRYWDGQTWTQQTAATPAALAAAAMAPATTHQPMPHQPMPHQPIPHQAIPQQPIPHQPIPQQPSGPMSAQPYVPTRALPGSLAGMSPHSGTGHRGSTVRVGNFYPLIAGAVAVAVAAAVAIPLAMHKSGHKSPTLSANQPLVTSTPAPQPSAAAQPTPNAVVTPANPAAPSAASAGDYHLPAAFAGYPRITDSRATQSETQVMSTWGLAGPRAFGVYGGPTGDPKAMAMLQSFALNPTGESEFVKGEEEGFSSGIPGVVWQATSTGSFGGVMQCGTTSAGLGASVCVFADKTTVGFTVVIGNTAAGQVEAADLRAASEPTPTI